MHRYVLFSWPNVHSTADDTTTGARCRPHATVASLPARAHCHNVQTDPAAAGPAASAALHHCLSLPRMGDGPRHGYPRRAPHVLIGYAGSASRVYIQPPAHGALVAWLGGDVLRRPGHGRPDPIDARAVEKLCGDTPDGRARWARHRYQGCNHFASGLKSCGLVHARSSIWSVGF